MPKRERTIRFKGLRKGDEVFIENKWWIVAEQYKRLPVRFPACLECGTSMFLKSIDGDVAHFVCDKTDCAMSESTTGSLNQVDVLVEPVADHLRAFELQRGRVKKVVKATSDTVVKIMRTAPAKEKDAA
jgi:hypothetical protein